MSYPSGRIVVLKENKEAPVIPEVSLSILFVLLLCDVTGTADFSSALGSMCFMAIKRKQLSLLCSVVCLRSLPLRLAALVSLIL